MTNKTYDEKDRLYYEQQGDYLIPCLALPNDTDKAIGIWGQRHLRYIKQHRRVFHVNLLTTGKLNSYLYDIEEQAEKMFTLLVKQLAGNDNITKKLKADNPILWVQKMNCIRNQAMEIVNNKIIYCVK